MMFDLDDSKRFSEIDRKNMLAHIDTLPDQLEQAWQSGISADIPDWKGIKKILITGMGGSAIGGDLLTAYIEPQCRIPVIVHREYGLPAWGADSETLVIASSHSGNTEEVLQTFNEAQKSKASCLAITTGGELEKQALAAGSPLIKFYHSGQPRSAVGYSFGLILSVLTRLNLIPDPEKELHSAVAAMQSQQQAISAEVPAARNIAKRYAGQMIGRWTVIFGTGILGPVARRWKTQINELAKAWSQFEIIPEANHNTIAGIIEPQGQLPGLLALFLRCPMDHPRNRLRIDLTRKFLMVEGINTDDIHAPGQDRLSYQWTCLHLGDYISYYLAMGYGIDPTPVEAIKNLKTEMKLAG